MDPQTNYAIALKDAAGTGAQDRRIRGAAGDYAKGLVQKFIDAGYTVEDLMSGRRPFIDPDTGHTDAAAIDSVAELAKKTTGAGALMGAERGAVGSAGGRLFSYKNMDRVPDVEQFDLPRNVSTSGRADTSAIEELLGRSDVRDNMLAAIQRGMDKGGANWYNTEELRQAFVNELGKSKGPAAYKKFLDLVAATSTRSDVPTNVRNASYYYSLLMQGKDLPEVGTKNPQPYGHYAQRTHQGRVRAVAEEGWDPLANPKPASFVENLAGNQAPGTMDTHAYRLPAILGRDKRFLATSFKEDKGVKPRNIQKELERGDLTMDEAVARPSLWESQPGKFEYAPLERYYKDLGNEVGLTPAQTQAAAWVGGGETTGLGSDASKTFLHFLEDRVNLTAQKRGVPPDVVLKDFIRGKIPLLGVGGAAALTIDQLTDEQKQQIMPSAPPPGDDWAAGLKEGEAY